MLPFEALLRDLDGTWPHPAGSRIRLQVLGSGALMLLTRYRRGTTDGDVLESSTLTEAVRTDLVELAGRGSKLHAKHHVYLDLVANGIPFFPRVPRWHEVPSLADLTHLEVLALDVTDVVVSKLERFSASDREDIDEMLILQQTSQAAVAARLREAVHSVSGDSYADRLRDIVENFHVVERDLIGGCETEIDLPAWA